jgi:spermidine/putrescine transport system substrate-binding protein
VTDVVASQTALPPAKLMFWWWRRVGHMGLARKIQHSFTIRRKAACSGQSLAMFEASKNKNLALKFIQYVMSPEGQARLATSSCYWGMPANRKAALSDGDKKILRFDEQPGFLARAQPYPAPDEALDKKMQDVWTEMLQAQ